MAFLRGKRKGKTLELFSTPLSEIPLKIFDHNINKQIEELSDKIINGTSNTNLETENKINDIIYKAYKLNDKEIKFVENFYIEKTT